MADAVFAYTDAVDWASGQCILSPVIVHQSYSALMLLFE